jgi:type II secretory pathway pseudopilin PulG
LTLVELLLALLIVSTLGTAVTILTVGAMDGDSALRKIGTAQSEIDVAVRRITNNLLECQSGSIVTGTSTLSTLTQADSADGFASGATVSYSLQNDPSATGQKMLMENDQRYGNNALVHNVTTFTVALVSGVSKLYQVDLVVSAPIPIERHFKVYARN